VQRVVVVSPDGDSVLIDGQRSRRGDDEEGGDESEHAADDRSSDDDPRLVEPAELLDDVPEGNGECRGKRAEGRKEESQCHADADAYETDDDDIGPTERERRSSAGLLGCGVVLLLGLIHHLLDPRGRCRYSMIPNWNTHVPQV